MVFLVRFSRQRIAKFWETVTWAADKQDVFARVTTQCRVNVSNVRTLLELGVSYT